MKISATPLHSGRISPMLYGGFVELLDDHVPGMWAEMLNDRSFEGVQPAVFWCYSTGAPTTCDREWDRASTWSPDDAEHFDGVRSARLTARPSGPAVLSQSGLAVARGMTYLFEGYFQADVPGLQLRVRLKTLHPDGSWIELGAADLACPTRRWSKQSCRITCSGTSDRAVFELSVAGSGDLWADKLSLMPASNLDGWRSDVVRAIKDARPAIIRWGGSVVDPGGYRWKDGIGSRDRRSPFPNRPWGRVDPNDVGIDEFLRLCELVDAGALICVSFSDGPQSAKDLVAYCNAGPETEWGGKRAANGHPAPYRVRYWQVGNELGDAAYIRGCAAICRAIKDADPGAIVMSSYPSPELLAEAGKYLDYVCPHHYEPDLGAHEASIDNAVRAIKAASLGHDVKVGVTEWNISGGWWGHDRLRLLTLDTALYTARYLNLLHRRSDVVGLACRSNMTNSHGAGMIQTSPAGMYLTPSYHVMKLYADHSRPVPVAVIDAPEGVDVSACASEDGTRLVVFAVNTRDEPVEVSLDLSAYGAGFAPRSGEVLCDTRGLRQPDVMNHSAAPYRVRAGELPLEGRIAKLPAYSAAAIECGAG
jgi:alpha-N-arabinofuranosidase